MANDELDDLPMADEASLESASKPEVKRGLASLRGTKRSTYLRRSVLRMLAMAPEEREAHNPRNGFEEIAKALVDAPKKGKEGAVAIAAFQERIHLLRQTGGRVRLRCAGLFVPSVLPMILLVIFQPTTPALLPKLLDSFSSLTVIAVVGTLVTGVTAGD